MFKYSSDFIVILASVYKNLMFFFYSWTRCRCKHSR